MGAVGPCPQYRPHWKSPSVDTVCKKATQMFIVENWELIV